MFFSLDLLILFHVFFVCFFVFGQVVVLRARFSKQDERARAFFLKRAQIVATVLTP